MYNDLFSFYRSSEWKNLLKVLKIERLNDEGEIICEYCGKPIVKAYDIIGHHKTELTEDNVKDANVALNPNNVVFVHHRCHNLIHEKLGYSTRQVFLVYGAALSGKSTWVSDNMQTGDLIIDMNLLWKAVSGGDEKPNRLKAVVFKMRDTLLDAVKYRLGRWENAYIVGGYPLQAERERICREMGAREVFIDATKQECLARAEAFEDEEKKKNYQGFIEEWFARYSPPLSEK